MNNAITMPCSITDGQQYDDSHGVGLPYHPMDYDEHGYLYEIVRTHRGWLVLRHSHDQSSDVLEHYFKKLSDAHSFINANPEDYDND
tara:strand:+ start:202 stop:462 length:261 start_codon:yes stop_codon:yes gene_type:complete